MFIEFGNFLLAMGLGFACVQILASAWGAAKNDQRYLTLGRTAAILQGGFLAIAFITLMMAFLVCDFSLLLVSLHDHTQLPWYYRMAASWGNHEGSLLLFVLILSGMSATLATCLKAPLFRARVLTSQGILILLFLIFLYVTSNPFTTVPFSVGEGNSLNPLLQDRGLLSHPPLLYLGYVGFSAPFSLAIAALWGNENGQAWIECARPWVLFSWSALTAGITLGSWWAYYELGWGGWWFWDPVENASFMPWLAGTALLHTLRTGQLYRWSLFLSLLTFGLSLLGTFLVRSGLITSIHSFAQDPEKGLYILGLLSLIMGAAFFLWIWKAPRLQSTPLMLISREGTLLLNSLLLCIGLSTVCLGTFYPLWCDFFWEKTVAIGTPYFERTFIPLMIPLFILLPIGCLFRKTVESSLSLFFTPLTATLGIVVLILFSLYPLSLWAFTGIVASTWILVGTLVAYKKDQLRLGPTLAHIGVALSLLGVSVGGGLRMDEMAILGVGESLTVDGTVLTLQDVRQGKEQNYRYERAILSYSSHRIAPEKRLYQPQNSLLSKTAIHTNGLRDLYVILGPYQGNNRWLIRASIIPLAPWIWIGGALMALGGIVSLVQASLRVTQKNPIALKFSEWLRPLKRLRTTIIFLTFSLPSFAATSFEKRAAVLYQEVRCPVCLGQSIADSETEESQTLKSFILEKLKSGESEEDIRKKLRVLMGDDILLRPPFEGHTLILWLAPFVLFLLVGGGVGWKVLRSCMGKKHN